MSLVFIFILLCGASKRFYLFEAPKRSVKTKKLCHFFPIFVIGTRKVKTVFCQIPDLCYFCFNIDTSRVTSKQFYKIMLF